MTTLRYGLNGSSKKRRWRSGQPALADNALHTNIAAPPQDYVNFEDRFPLDYVPDLFNAAQLTASRSAAFHHRSW
ncbi:MAG: hypothetical protein MI924_25415 [Chloroflexales bacterium]|nr:hypothetical protein [Chloroflexales bacterium]